MITALYASLLGLVLIFLSIRVIRFRRRYQLAIGTNEDTLFNRTCRAQANFTEYTPFFLILLYLAEQQGLAVLFLHLAGVLFVSGRLSHAYGLLVAEPQKNNFQPRIAGMILTFNLIGALSLFLVTHFLFRFW